MEALVSKVTKYVNSKNQELTSIVVTGKLRVKDAVGYSLKDRAFISKYEGHEIDLEEGQRVNINPSTVIALQTEKGSTFFECTINSIVEETEEVED